MPLLVSKSLKHHSWNVPVIKPCSLFEVAHSLFRLVCVSSYTCRIRGGLDALSIHVCHGGVHCCMLDPLLIAFLMIGFFISIADGRKKRYIKAVPPHLL